MKIQYALFAVVGLGMTLFTSIQLLAQEPTIAPPPVITMNQEPHHHLKLHNDYVNLFNAEATPGDTLLLHRHDHDAVAIAIGNQQVTVGIPGKPDVHQRNADGQVRIQPSGYVHSTHVDGPEAYLTVAVELLLDQTGKRNLCAAVMPGQPLNCPETSANTSSVKQMIQPQFESDQTRIQIVRVPPHQQVDLGDGSNFQLIVVLDPASVSAATGKSADQILRPGDFLWFDVGGTPRIFKNGGEKEARFVDLEFRPVEPPTRLLSAPGGGTTSRHVVRVGMQEVAPRPIQTRF